MHASRRFLIALGLTFISLLPSCNRGKAAGRERGGGGPVPVVVASAVKKDLPVEVRAVGTVEAQSTVEVTPQVTGLVLDVHFKEGDFVKRGDLLFTIDTRPYTTTLAAAQAALQKNQALAAQAKEEAERYERLVKEGVASAQELARARANAASLEAAVAADKAQIGSASLNVQFAKIRSPIDARTGTVLVHAGNVVRANDSKPLVVLRSLVPAYVRFAVPEEYLPRIRSRFREGTLAVVATPRGQGGKPSRGELTFLENSVDSATGTIGLKARFDNHELELWPGEFVDAALELAVEPNIVVVPEAAVQQGQEGTYVYVIKPDQKAELRKVKAGQVTRGDVAVSGVEPGERVVVDGQIRLRDGAAVAIKDK